jgi:hypothetical protein
MRRAPLALALALTAACSGGGPSAAPEPGQGNLAARWWNWTESVPASDNPLDDPTGRNCARRQAADVWFLAGTHGGAATRSCTVPKGEPIYVPVLTTICEPTPGDSARQAIQRCSADAEVATATLDGKALPVKEADSGGVFTFTADALSQTMSEGQHDAVAWGLWVGPLQLTPGTHTLALTGKAGAFSTAVSYRLSVG